MRAGTCVIYAHNTQRAKGQFYTAFSLSPTPQICVTVSGSYVGGIIHNLKFIFYYKTLLFITPQGKILHLFYNWYKNTTFIGFVHFKCILSVCDSDVPLFDDLPGVQNVFLCLYQNCTCSHLLHCLAPFLLFI